jgi:hypothetical protein
MRFLIGDYYFAMLDSLSRSEVGTLMNNSAKGYLRLDEESYCKRHFVMCLYHYSDTNPFYIVIPSETGLSPSVMLIAPDIIAIGYDSTVAIFNCSDMNLLLKRDLIGPLIYMKRFDSKLIVIAETGVTIFDETGKTVKSFETDLITSFKFASDSDLICYTDSGTEFISV